MNDLIDKVRRECDHCYTPQGQTVRACSYHEGWLDGYGEREAESKVEVERLRGLTDAYGELLDAVFDWLGSDSVQDQEKALVVVATKAHEVHKLTEAS